jgi:ABC-type nitrate/sulfonate/bicarbonate transport system substrate-binding protein
MLAGSVLAAPMIMSRRVHSQERRKISFTLPFLAEGGNAYAYVAKAQGYWDALGLDVAISRGYGSVAAAQAIGAGQFQFGLAAPSAAIQQAAKGVPLVSLACAGYDATMGICLLKDSPIHKPKDLEGKRMASVVTSGEHPFLPVFAEMTGFDMKTVNIVQTDPNVRQRLLVTGQVDCMSGFAVSFIPPLVSQGFEARAMLYNDFGLTLYNNALLTQPEMVNKEPKLCADIASGLLQAIKFTMLNSEEAIKLFLQQVPEAGISATGVEQIRLGVGIFNNSMLHEPAFKNSIGYAVPKDYETMTDLVMKYVAAPGEKPPKIGDLLTNDFIGKLTFTPEEWAVAQANAKPYRKYLGEET